MKKLVLVFTLAAFALTGAAFAQDPAYQDNIGVYADPEGTELCATLGAGVPLTVYMMITKATEGQVDGFEVNVRFDNMEKLGERYNGTNIVEVEGAPGDYIIGYGTPTPILDRTVVLMEFDIWVSPLANDVTVPSFIYLDNVFNYSPDYAVPAYAVGEDIIVPAHPITIDGHEGGPVFMLNNGCDPVATEQNTWGGVKGLYR